MSKKFRIGIIGIGGVGGFFGGKLAAAYKNSDEVEIIFIARGANKEAIEKNGLKIISPTKETVVYPSMISDDYSKIGILDLLIISVKNYDLESILQMIQPSLNKQTIILPLLNGVDASDKIKQNYPEQEVWEGCVYCITRVIEPGIIKESGRAHSLYFGSTDKNSSSLKLVLSIFSKAEINAHLSENIIQTIWEKFIFISVIAALTCYFDEPMGAILENEDHKNILLQLLSEIYSIAEAKNIFLPKDIIQTTVKKMESLPYETYSSMHFDYKNGNRTEYKSLIEYIILSGNDLKISTPAYDKILKPFIK
ncbi:MAG: ketopantoate reductase family protein [Bacteroidia bacterium]